MDSLGDLVGLALEHLSSVTDSVLGVFTHHPKKVASLSLVGSLVWTSKFLFSTRLRQIHKQAEFQEDAASRVG